MEGKPEGSRQRQQNQAYTQADRDFIRAAREGLTVSFYFFAESFLGLLPDCVGKVVVVDRYFVQVELENHAHPAWIAKNAIFATEIPKQEKRSTRA